MAILFQLTWYFINLVISHLYIVLSSSSYSIKDFVGLLFLRLPFDGSQKIRSWAKSLLVQQLQANDILLCLIVSISFGRFPQEPFIGDWDGFVIIWEMFHGRILLNLVILLLLVNLVGGFRLGSISLIIKFRSSVTLHHGSQLLVLLP